MINGGTGGWLAVGERAEHEGAVRIDIRRGAAPICADLCALPFASACFAGAEILHVLEHLLPTDGQRALAEVHRVLMPGGCLLIGVPDVAKCARTLLAGNEAVLWNIYSPDERPAQQHRWGYTHATLRRALGLAGFVECDDAPRHPSDPHELRLVAWKHA